MDDVKEQKKENKSLFVPSRKLEWSAPFRWLKLGWEDYKNSRQLSMAYGLFFAVGGLLLSSLVVRFSSTMFLFSIGVFFVLMGPLMAFGLYDIPRQIEHNEKPTLKHS